MKILAFGEILWDIFPDDKKIGGAPFNFAAHCAKHGAETYLVSAVGMDENGFLALDAAKSLGIRRDHITQERRYETGYCKITLENGKPQYDLVSDVAYDHIQGVCPSGEFDVLYFGTLALRSPDSRRAFEKTLRYTKAKELFFDVNFRNGYYTRELVNMLLRETTILKMSDEEIGFFGKKGEINTCLELSKSYPKLKYILLTLGAEGAIVFDCRKRTILYSDKPKSKAISTVGAGDSFAASFVCNLLNGFSTDVCLDRAVTLSDFVVTQIEAVPDYDVEDIYSTR